LKDYEDTLRYLIIWF